jgi:hypothetical protein
MPGCQGVANWQHQLNGSSEVTKIPTDGIAVDGRMFLHYKSVKQWDPNEKWRTNYSALAYSDDAAENWSPFNASGVVPPPTAVVWPSSSNFAQVAFVREGGYVYLSGIPAGRWAT